MSDLILGLLVGFGAVGLAWLVGWLLTRNL